MAGWTDLWAGKWIVLSRDGAPMHFTVSVVQHHGQPCKIYDHIGVAHTPEGVRFFDSEADARHVCDKQWPGWGMTVHRVERLAILDERFSRGYVEGPGPRLPGVELRGE